MAWEDLNNPLVSAETKLAECLNAGVATQAQVDDALAQRDYFNANRAAIEQLYPGKIVAAVNFTLVVGDDWAAVEAQARAQQPNSIYWIEAVLYDHRLVGAPVK